MYSLRELVITMRYSLLSVLPALAAASPTFQVETIHKDAAPVLSTTGAKVVPNSYMVVFKKHVKDSHAKEHHDWVQSIHTKNQERMELRKRGLLDDAAELFNGMKHTYDIVGGMMGYSGHFDDETIEEIRRHPDVSHRSFLHTDDTMYLCDSLELPGELKHSCGELLSCPRALRARGWGSLSPHPQAAIGRAICRHSYHT